MASDLGTEPRRSARNPEPQPKRSAQRGDIQGMRAVAVLLVVLSHAHIAGFTGGYVGVDVFFVISGFLITGILAREVRRSGRVSILDFYARRARRILPAASVALVAIAVAAAFVYTTGNLRLVLKDVVWAAFFGENINLARAGTDYFSTSSFVSPVQHFWSLAVEEQFYLAWPALIAALVLLARRGRSADGEHTRETVVRWSAAVIAVLVVLSFIWSVWRTGAEPQMAYYSTFTRGWELGIGALLALCAGWVSRRPAPLKLVATWVGLAAIVLAGTQYDDATPFPGHHAALPVLGAALVLAGGIDGPRWGARVLLDTRPMRFVGDISYSLYLWHWPLLILPPAYLGHPVSLRGRLVLIAAAIVLAWLSYRFVETPFRSVGSQRRSRALVLWPVAVALVLVSALGVRAGDSWLQGSKATEQAASFDRAAAQQQGADSYVRDVRQAAALSRDGADLPGTLHPALTDLFDDVSRAPGQCMALAVPKVSHPLCSGGDASSSRTVAVIGDSHMGVWYDVLNAYAKDKGLRLVPFTKASCLPIDQLQWYYGKPYPECSTYRDWVVGQIAKLEPAYIVMSGSAFQTMADPQTQRPPSAARGTQLFEQGVDRWLQRLEAASPQSKRQIISDGNLLPKDAGACLGSRTSTMATCAKPHNALVEDRNAAWQRAARRHDTQFVDMTPYFCDERTCPVVVRDIVVYRDRDHITTTYAEHLAPVLRSRLAW
ncbi:acyltransferase family protein [Luteipulveratus halotolerans]|uniref:Acyltransferase n=1 Tax=Luteipulveratus halotolerans TaxID=1631356 RepID=A0A0L6CFX0_9MICO|nr:acyltransferase family protein [Luteipulveratus halotolerans]KNX36428.1 hypothetical protein VV01_03545 [Luteipulveratus halotolerans]